MDFMFDGLPIDCNVDDFAGTAVCSMLSENSDGLMKDGEDKYRFSLFGAVCFIIKNFFFISQTNENFFPLYLLVFAIILEKRYTNEKTTTCFKRKQRFKKCRSSGRVRWQTKHIGLG